MEISPRVHEIYMASGAAAFPSTPATGVIAAGFRNAPSITIEPFNPITDDRGRKKVQFENFKLELPSLELDKAKLTNAIAFLKAGGVSCKVVCAGVTQNSPNYLSDGGIFSFELLKALGIDFEISITQKEQWIKFTLERAYKQSDALTLITSSKTNTLPNVFNIPMENYAGIPSGFTLPNFGSITISELRLSDYKLNIKTKSNKGAYNQSSVHGFDVTLEGAIRGANPDEIATFLTGEVCPDINVPILTDATYNLTLKQGGLTATGKFTNDNDKREATVSITGNYDLPLVDATGSNIIFNSQIIVEHE
jgi:hypothetical protein